MKKLIYLLMLVSGSLFAQDFDFKCADISDQEALDMAIAEADEKHTNYVTTDWNGGEGNVYETYTYSGKTVNVEYVYDVEQCFCLDGKYSDWIDINKVTFTIGSLSKILYIQRSNVAEEEGCDFASDDFLETPCGN